ncbi:MAG TPA: regulatory protein RecX [Candidatus Dormibacteraeota bacterium]|nr:regulatory protein RecX [Candidatus Dormibacteraeota bacterium]
MRWLAQRQHAEAELERKLRRRGVSPETATVVRARLRELGYLDDREFARSLVAHRSRRRGPALIAAELAARGIDPRLAAEAVAEVERDRQLDAARRLVVRRPDRSPRDLAAWLTRRGFSMDVIREVVGEGALDPFPGEGGPA